jgi:hypothetical protein
VRWLRPQAQRYRDLHVALAIALGARRHRLTHSLARLANLCLYGIALWRPIELVVGLIELFLRVVEEHFIRRHIQFALSQ